MADQPSLNGRATASAAGSSSTEFDGVAEFVDDLAGTVAGISSTFAIAH